MEERYLFKAKRIDNEEWVLTTLSCWKVRELDETNS